MSLTKRQPAFDRMMEQAREREQMELARREQEFLNSRKIKGETAHKSKQDEDKPSR